MMRMAAYGAIPMKSRRFTGPSNFLRMPPRRHRSARLLGVLDLLRLVEPGLDESSCFLGRDDGVGQCCFIFESTLVSGRQRSFANSVGEFADYLWRRPSFHVDGAKVDQGSRQPELLRNRNIQKRRAPVVREHQNGAQLLAADVAQHIS